MIPILQIENRDTEIRINLSYTAKLPQAAELVSTPGDLALEPVLWTALPYCV